MTIEGNILQTGLDRQITGLSLFSTAPEASINLLI
jgi:hypothetical protein